MGGSRAISRRRSSSSTHVCRLPGTISGSCSALLQSVEFGVHPTELVTRAGELFARGRKAPAAEDAQKVIDDLHRKIGQLQVGRDFLAGQPAISRVLRGGR